MKYDLDDILQKIDRLPELFHVAIRVARMLDDFNLDIKELSNLINVDQSLTTLLLKFCNSAHYGFSKKINSVNDAITKIGFKTLKSLVFVAISQSVLYQDVKGYNLDKEDLWYNSISCAVYSRYLAKKIKFKDPETAFTAGLLKDIGKLMIQEYVGSEYDKLLKIINSQNMPFSEAEMKLFGFNHCTIGAEMAKKWNFPDALIDAIRYHHAPQQADADGSVNSKIVYIVHIADSLSMMLGAGLGNDGMMYNIELKSLENIGIKPTSENIENLISEMIDLNEEISKMAGLINEK